MTDTPHISVQHLNVRIGEQHILKDININIPDKKVTSIIGPSGCGKTTLLKTFNRLLDNSVDVSVTGKVLVDGGRFEERRDDTDPPAGLGAHEIDRGEGEDHRDGHDAFRPDAVGQDPVQEDRGVLGEGHGDGGDRSRKGDEESAPSEQKREQRRSIGPFEEHIGPTGHRQGGRQLGVTEGAARGDQPPDHPYHQTQARRAHLARHDRGRDEDARADDPSDDDGGRGNWAEGAG